MPMPPARSVCSVSYAGPLRASESIPDWPILRPNTGMMSSASATSATPVGDVAAPDDRAGPGRPAAGGGRLVADPRVVDARADARQQGRQQREHHRDADQRDEHPAEPHAAQERHRHHEQRQQADGDRDPGGEDGVAGRLHRDDDGLVVVAAVRPLLPPSGDDQQRVVDGHAEPDQGDQELHDEADVGERGQAEDEQERRQDRDGGDDAAAPAPGTTRTRRSAPAARPRPRAASRPARSDPAVSPPADSSPYDVSPLVKPWLFGRGAQRRLDLGLDARAEGLWVGPLDQGEGAPAVVGHEPGSPVDWQVDDPQPAATARRTASKTCVDLGLRRPGRSHRRAPSRRPRRCRRSSRRTS